MSSAPPPKEGEVVTSSTVLRHVIADIEKGQTDKAVKALKELIEDAGY